MVDTVAISWVSKVGVEARRIALELPSSTAEFPQPVHVVKHVAQLITQELHISGPTHA
jgi:hypothetical protein